jgi:hypothetical protein
MGQRNSDSGRYAVIWLATTYIAVIGAGAAGFVIVAVSENPEFPLIILGLIVGGFFLLAIIFHIRWEEPVNQMKFWLFARDRRDNGEEYQAARRRIKMREEYGDKQPPSIESVRDAADHGGAWVPRSNVKKDRK